MNVSFQVNSDYILIKCIDSHFNIYKCVINQYDPFVATFCGNKLDKLNNILQNHVIQEMDDHVILKVSEPVELQYILKKEKFNESNSFSMILGKIESMEERIRELKKQTESLESSTSDLIEQLEEGVVLTGYAGGIIPKDATILLLNINNYPTTRKIQPCFGSDDYLIFPSAITISGTDYGQQITLHSNISVFNTCFNGNSIKSVSFLTNLTIFAIHTCHLIADFSPLRKCIKLAKIFFYSKIYKSLDQYNVLKAD